MEGALGGGDAELYGQLEGRGAGGAGEDAAVGGRGREAAIGDEEEIGPARLEHLVLGTEDQGDDLAELGLARLEPIAVGPLVGAGPVGMADCADVGAVAAGGEEDRRVDRRGGDLEAQAGRDAVAVGKEVYPHAAEVERGRGGPDRGGQIGGEALAEDLAGGGLESVEVGDGADGPAVGDEQRLEEASGGIGCGGGGHGSDYPWVQRLFPPSASSQLPAMEASPADDDIERDTADDWRIEPERSIATVAELEGRIDVALATARGAEEAALEIGAASLEAAEQARRAAALAERASAAAARAASEVASAPRVIAPLAPPPRRSEPPRPLGVRTPVESPAAVEPAAPIPPEPAVEAAATPPPPVSEPAALTPATPLRPRPPRRQPDPFDERLTAFRQRAESVMIRLQKLEAGTPPGDGPSEVVRLR